MLQTDASFRFERGADPNITAYALKRAAMLIKDIAGGQISSEIKDVYPEPIKKWIVDINYDKVNRLIGKEIEKDTIVNILQDLDIEVLATSPEGLKLLIPTFKVDVKREVDIVEEILRIYGYNNIDIPEKLNSSVSLRQQPDLERIQNIVADYLVAQGFIEIMNNSLTKSEYIEKSTIYEQDHSVELLNPLSKDLDILRQTLIFGGLETINYNQNRKTGDLKIFEFGKIYKRHSAKTKGTGVKNYFEEKHLALFTTGRIQSENWNSANVKADFYTAKAVVESILNRLGIDRKKLTLAESSSDDFTYSLDYLVNDKVLVQIAEVSKKLLKAFDIKQPVYLADINWDKIIDLLPQHDLTYKAISKFPAVRRDLALVVNKTVTFETLKEIAFKAERKILKEVGIFDIYEGEKIPEGKKSYALSFVLQDEGKTLTDKIIDKAMKRIQQALEKEAEAMLR
jgi:phenylalanyl-tRNA synthetase beta chain